MKEPERAERNRDLWKHCISHLTGSRAAKITAAVVSVFLCLLTLFEFTALHLELEIPALAVHSGRKMNPEINGEQHGQEDTVLPSGTEESFDRDSADTLQYGESDEEALPYLIRINRKQNCVTVYTADQNGEFKVPYKAMICSTGLYNATPRGTYHLSDKYLWRELYGGVYGQYATRITGGILFHSVPYYKKSKNTLCTGKYNKLGQQASMGCVRLTSADALWIMENCPEGTAVEIYEDEDPGPMGKPDAAVIDTNDPKKGWDPTDPDETNPWNEKESWQEKRT